MMTTGDGPEIGSVLGDQFRDNPREILVELLGLANQPQGMDRLLERLVVFLLEHAGCECTAIRLRDGQDFPYYHQHGFTPDFIELENSLCALGANGNLLLNENGDVMLECMCGHVLCGRFDPTKAYFTPRGSFWTNSTSDLVAVATEEDILLQNLRGRCVERFESVALIPMRSEGRTYGMIHLTDTRKNRFSPDLIALMEEISSIAANVVARKQAEDALRETNKRLKLLSDTASELLTSDNPQQCVRHLCEQVMDFLGCDLFFNFLAERSGDCLRLNAYAEVTEEIARSIERLDYGVGVCGCVARDGCRIVAENIMDTPDERTWLVKSFGVQAYACHPLLSQGGRVIGTLSFGARSRTTFSQDDLTLMKTVADQVATAMGRIRLLEEQRRLYEREHHIAETLQRALIPPEVPETLYGYRFAVRYLPALREAEVGGDFFDIFDLGDEKIGVLIGDVVGKGLPAAIRVAAARYTIRGYAYLDPRPARVLTLANRSLCKDQPAETGMLTAFFAVIDARLGAVTYVNAGHEQPLISDHRGIWEELGNPGLPLGIMEDADYLEDSRRLNPGERIVMITDGITEARKPGPDLFGVRRVRECLTRNLTSSIEDMADCLLNAATDHAGGQLQDDAAIVVFEQADS